MTADVRSKSEAPVPDRGPRNRQRDRDRQQVARPARPEHGGWGWILQVFTGGALLVLVIVHLVAQHFIVDAPGGLRDYDSVLSYLNSPVIIVIESLFLIAVTWHAMLGVRSILFDLGFGHTGRRRATTGVTALGVLTLAYGFWMIAVLAAK